MNFEETSANISLHGLGFLQVKLGGLQRLHVWHPDLPRRRCFEHSGIHDHRFGFDSTVLVGTQINEVHYDDNFEPATHRAFLHEGARNPATGNRPWIMSGMLRVSPSYTEVFEAGETYHMDPYVFHSTTPGGDGRVATLMVKTSEGDTGARSLCRIGVEPDVDFCRTQMDADEMWAAVRDVLGS